MEAPPRHRDEARAGSIRRMGQRDADNQAAIYDAGQRQRGDQRRHAKHRDADAVYTARGEAGSDRHDGRRRGHGIAAVHQRRAQYAAEGRNGADRQVEPLAARGHDDCLAKAE